MAKPKRHTAIEFEILLNKTIDALIENSQFIEEESRKDIRVIDIANTLGVDVVTLRRWSNELTKKTPRKYLAEYRIGKSKVLLLQGIKPSKVTRILGFIEHKNFSTTFKRYCGMTPTMFLKKYTRYCSP